MPKAIAYSCLAILLALPGAAFAHGHGHVMGTIQMVHPDRLDVRTKEGKSVSIPFAKSTRFFRGNAKATAAALKAGSRVVVHLAADGSAAEIRLPSAAAARAHRQSR
ncbi:MAG TPA: hypothetical protein VGQ75_09700 [Thermoanaerobaculia bacterium]|jgi:hypothetical protein|nr:hypothetical protein [Thermoanaerobaculia bacterium]